MTDRVIPCPECNKYGKHFPCGTCDDGSGFLEDRRKPTPNDRAVERIKRMTQHDARRDNDYGRGFDLAVATIQDIINEEASRG